MLTSVVMSRINCGMTVFGKGIITNVYRYTGKSGRPMALVTFNGEPRSNIIIGYGESIDGVVRPYGAHLPDACLNR